MEGNIAVLKKNRRAVAKALHELARKQKKQKKQQDTRGTPAPKIKMVVRPAAYADLAFKELER